jgi:hypothetical protein
MRTRDWGNEAGEQTLEYIAEYGYATMHVFGDDRSMSWSYSIGMYDTWGQPEIVMTGFPQELATSILGHAAVRNREGRFLTPEQRDPEFIGRFDCIFRPVEDVWIQRLMLYCAWFYGDTSFPVLQCICTDFENRFPWEPGFDPTWRAKQALLFAGADKTDAEKKLWNTSAPKIGS